MYRVSANKLSKTSSTPGRGRDLSTKSPGRAGEQREFLLVRTQNQQDPGFVPTLAFSRSSPGCVAAARRLPPIWEDPPLSENPEKFFFGEKNKLFRKWNLEFELRFNLSFSSAGD